MSAKNLNRVLKTVLAGSVKLPAPADRIGSGVNAVIDHYPTAVLSQGRFLTPRLPEPEPRSRRTVADDESMPTPETAGSSGSASGLSARLTRVTAPLTRTFMSAVKPTAFGMPRRTVKPSRVSHPWSHGKPCPVGRDCQSPDRQQRRKDRTANRRNRRWQRTANPAAAAGA